MASKPETVFRKRVRADLKALKQQGLPLAYFPIQQKTINGDPDFLLCVNGFFIGLELKDENGVVSPLQEIKLQSIANAHGMAFVTTKKNWQPIREYLERLLKGEDDNEVHQNQVKKSTTEQKPNPKAALQTSEKKSDVCV